MPTWTQEEIEEVLRWYHQDILVERIMDDLLDMKEAKAAGADADED